MSNLFLSLYILAPLLWIHQTIDSKSFYLFHPIQAPVKSMICTYRLTFRSDTVAKYSQTEYFRLFITGTQSLFQSKRQSKLDSVYASYDNLPFSQATVSRMGEAIKSTPKTLFSYSIYKNTTLSKITVVDRIEPLSKYSYEEPTNLLTWHITPSTSVINGYTCQQATLAFRGRQFTAWFTRQIPIADGPYKFCGLPGLIVKISDTKNAYDFELTGLVQSVSVLTDINLPKGAISTTREKFKKGVADYNASIVDRASQFGVSFGNADAVKQNWKEKLSRRNNPLELQ